MKKLWESHKRFGIPVVAGTAVFGAWLFWGVMGIRSDTEDQRRAYDRLLMEARGLASEGVATAEALVEVEGDLQRRREDLAVLIDRCSFGLPEWAQRAIDQGNASITFQTLCSSEADAFASRGISLKESTTLGFQIRELPDTIAGEHLFRLAAVIRVLNAMVASRVREVQRIDPFDAHYDADAPAFAAGQFTNGARIRVRFQAPAGVVFKVLHRLQSPGEGESFMTVMEFKAEQENPGKDLLRAEMVIGALRIDSGGHVAGSDEEEEWD